MKLWDSLTTCLILLSCSVRGSPVRGSPVKTKPPRSSRSASPREPPPVHINISITSPEIPPVIITHNGGERASVNEGETYSTEEVLPGQFEDVVDFIKVTISRVRRSSSSSSQTSSSTSPVFKPVVGGTGGTRHRRERKKGQKGPSKTTTTGGKEAKAGGGDSGRRSSGRSRASKRSGGGAGRGDRGRGQGCVLKQIHLNVSDLGLGYRSGEEMIFRYCSGPCRKSETNYDKILNNLASNRKFPPKDPAPPHACCRPTVFDDDLSFLDDNMIYHTVRRHSARKCGCV